VTAITLARSGGHLPQTRSNPPATVLGKTTSSKPGENHASAQPRSQDLAIDLRSLADGLWPHLRQHQGRHRRRGHADRRQQDRQSRRRRRRRHAGRRHRRRLADRRAGADKLYGGGNHDVASYIDSPDAIFIDLENGNSGDNGSNAALADSFGDTLDEIEQINGSVYDDLILGDQNANEFYGYDGNDDLYGGAGNDALFGMQGSDYLSGGEGKDTLNGGAGNDEIHGGNGYDQIEGGAGNDRIYAEGDGAEVHGGAGDDTITGGSVKDFLYGDSGIDIIYGGGGDDFIYGGNDKDFLRGENGHDTIDGGAGNDNLAGGEGNDILKGDIGDDELKGEAGADTLWGGQGQDVMYGDGTALKTADIFQLNVQNGGNDTIYDFDIDNDVLQLLGATINGNDVAVDHTANGWLKLEFEDGGSVTFLGNEAMAGIQNVAQLNFHANVLYADGLA
jgi:Ca2+-binding RTX toxin-like protein